MPRFSNVLLEDWLRDYYFTAEWDVSGSGVEDFGFGELREILGLPQEELDGIVFHDSRSLGGDGLRAAIADRWAGGRADRVMATHGSTEATFLIMNALLAPGDEVVVLDPCYPQLALTAEAIGCALRRWPLRLENGFRPDLDDLRALLGPRTRMVVANFPHNPTGATLSEDEQSGLLAAVSGHGAWLLWDDAFRELTHGTAPLPPVVGRYERAISTSTLSKGYGLPGLRVGWCIAEPEVLRSMVQVRDYLTLSLSPLVERIAEHAVRGADRLLSVRLAQAGRNLEIVRRWMEEHAGQVEWVPPRGGVTVFPRLAGIGGSGEGGDTEAFCHRLAQERKTLVVPGNCFGRPEHIRLGFGAATPVVEKGLEHLSDLLAREAG